MAERRQGAPNLDRLEAVGDGDGTAGRDTASDEGSGDISRPSKDDAFGWARGRLPSSRGHGSGEVDGNAGSAGELDELHASGCPPARVRISSREVVKKR